MLGPIARLLPYIRRHAWVYFGLAGTLAIDIVLSLFFAWYFQHLTEAATSRQLADVEGLVVLGLGAVIVGSLHAYALTVLRAAAIGRVQADLRETLYRHLLHVPYSDLARHTVGELAACLLNDIDKVEGAIGDNQLNLIRMPLTGLCAFVYLLTINVQLALISVLLAPPASSSGYCSNKIE
ncbi:ABC transporter transmembrane domain-containing protein [Alicyclobacillus herbarius]|uniref:ABC transporter transmembrane domain-containing protein n=1 Tax=Alicyclobacillus herbarius TaxID=122960 RepID=UPI0003F81E07|nr:ABC transporter transmembrane domain-containing protein [Alicyclobacillus herbarius]